MAHLIERLHVLLRIVTSAELPRWIDDGRLAIGMSIASATLSIASINHTPM